MKKVIKVILIIITIVVIYLLVLFYINNRNHKYLDNISKDIKKHYKIEEKITYSNVYGNYYIFTTDTKVIVLNKEYEEVLENEINILAENKKNYELIYKNSKLMFEETILKKDKLIYKYYDATSYKLIKETTMEKR